MQKEFGTTHTNSTINIDGKHFEACKFINCALIMTTGLTSLDRCEFDGCNLQVVEGSPASGAIAIHKMFNQDSDRHPLKRW
jgi:hypothetical protein